MKIFDYIYFAIAIVAIMTMESNLSVYMIVKPLIAGSLLTYYIVSLKKQHSMIILGLVAAIIGDVLLIFNGDFFFKAGLVAFLIMQICYILYLKQFQDRQPNNIQKFLRIFVVVLCLFFNILFWVYAIPEKYLILLYSVFLTTMVYISLGFPRLNKALSIIGIGALCFMFSDLFIAINKFIFTSIYLKYTIMPLYIIGQYLIIKGITQDALHYFELVDKANEKAVKQTKKKKKP